MIKSSNVTLKAREKDGLRLKSKLVHLEGKSLAARQRLGKDGEMLYNGSM